MKFLVLLYCTTFVAHCMAKSSDTKSYLAEATSPFNWAGWMVNRFSILFFVFPCVVLYYIPESRSYARKGCHIVIDVVANGMKAALSGSLSSPNCYEAGCLSNSSKRCTNPPAIQDSDVLGNVQKDQFNTSHVRRRHRVKQESKIEEDKTRVHDRRRHRHNERAKYPREEKNGVRHGQSTTQHHQSQSTPKTSSKEPEIRAAPPPAPHFYQDKKIDGFYYPGTRNEDDAEPGYSTSFVISGVKTHSFESSNYRQGSVTTLEEEEYPQTVSKHRSRPSRRSRHEDSLHPENDGPTRDCESFLSTDLRDCRDLDSKVGLSTTTEDYPEKVGAGISSREDQPHHEDSTSTVQEFEDAVADLDRDTSKRAQIQIEDINDYENDGFGPAGASEPRTKDATAFPPADGNRTGWTPPVRRVNFQEKPRDRARKAITEDDENFAPTTKSEEVLGQLGDQIAKLEKTIRMMKPVDVRKKERGQSNSYTHDYAVQNIETVIKEMKRSFSKVDERIKRRRRSSPDREPVKERVRRPPQTAVKDDAGSPGSVVDEERASSEIPQDPEDPPRVPNLAIFRSETLLEDDEDLGPIVTNRVKPLLIRTFEWLFTGCPGACAEKKHGVRVGKGGNLRTAAEWIP